MLTIARKRLHLTLISFLMCASTIAQQKTSPLNKSEHQAILQGYDQSAQNFVAKNLNRFALDRLAKYDHALDSLYEQEKKDTLAAIEQTYLKSTSAKQEKRAESKERITTLTEQKEILETHYHKLLRKAGIAFAVWMLIVLIVMQIRRKRVKLSDTTAADSTVQITAAEAQYSNGKHLFTHIAPIIPAVNNLNAALKSVGTVAKRHAADPAASADWNVLLAQIEKVQGIADRQEAILKAIQSQELNANDELLMTDINQLCDTYLEIASYGFNTGADEFVCQVSKDFEKRLPTIKVIPAAVGTLLLNVLSNAFQSVKEKAGQSIKGYQPKISISTRILPRFLQIRVRDNGIGMNDEVLTRATEEFFTTKPLESAIGLGLSEGSAIMTVLHKGEIKIETEKGNSTDVYIKFFIS